MNLKPQDVLVLLKSAGAGGVRPYNVMAKELGMSASEVHAATRRAIAAGLADPTTRLPLKEALVEFLVHGIRYAFPVTRGGITRGMPTSYAAPPLSEAISPGKDDIPPVWPDKDGARRGYASSPLCPSAVFAARKDAMLYEILTLVDALREGRARERDQAVRALRKRLGVHEH